MSTKPQNNPTRLLAESTPGETRLAALDATGHLLDYAIWRPGHRDGLGDVYRARITAQVPAMAGSFLALPDGDGFLPDSEGAAGSPEGTILTVRITRAPLAGKGARLTAKLDQTDGPQGLVTRGPSPLDDLLAAHPGAPIELDDPALAAQLKPRPVTLHPAPFRDIQDQLDALTSPAIDLPGGMRATIHPTPALVAIDLDTAAATAARQAKPRAQLAANLAALPALARQIRLRNLSGAILIDPAGLSAKRRALLGPALADSLAPDPLRPRLLGFTALGLAEILRPRRRPALHELLGTPHAAALAALRSLARESAAAPHRQFRLHASPAIAAALEHDQPAQADLLRRTGRPLALRPDPTLQPTAWRLEEAP